MVVSWPWPMVCVPVISDTVPSCSKRMSTFSVGRPPVALMWQATPMPRSRHRFAFLAACRETRQVGLPVRVSKVAGKSPLSTVNLSALVIGMPWRQSCAGADRYGRNRIGVPPRRSAAR